MNVCASICVIVESSNDGFRPVSDQFQTPRRDMFGMPVCRYLGLYVCTQVFMYVCMCLCTYGCMKFGFSPWLHIFSFWMHEKQENMPWREKICHQCGKKYIDNICTVWIWMYVWMYIFLRNVLGCTQHLFGSKVELQVFRCFLEVPSW